MAAELDIPPVNVIAELITDVYVWAFGSIDILLAFPADHSFVPPKYLIAAYRP